MANTVELIIKATDRYSQALKAPIKSTDDFGKALTALRVPIAGATAAAGAMFAMMAKQSIDAADNMLKSAESIGTTTEYLSTLKYAAEQSGSSFENLQTALTKLNIATVSSASELQEQLAAFKAIGVEATTASGALVPIETLLPKIADAFQQMENGADKATIASKLFGKAAGPELVQFLNEGSVGIKKLQDDARAMGLEISTTTAKQADTFNDNLAAMKSAAQGAANAITSKMLPAFVSISGLLKGDAIEGANGLKNVLEGIGEIVGFVSRTVMTSLTLISNALSIVGQEIGVWMSVMAEAASGNWRQAFENVKEMGSTFSEHNKSLSEQINQIWSDGEVSRTETAKLGNDSRYANALKALDDEKKLKTTNQKKDDEEKKKKEAEEKEREKRQAGAKMEILNNIATFQNAKTKEMAAVGKAAAIAVATIDTYQGATKALAQGGIWGIPLAASIVAMGLANVAQIAGVALADGGIVKATPGGVPAIIGEGGRDEAVIPLDDAGSMLGGRITINLDGKTIIDFLTNAQRSGEYNPVPA